MKMGAMHESRYASTRIWIYQLGSRTAGQAQVTLAWKNALLAAAKLRLAITMAGRGYVAVALVGLVSYLACVDCIAVSPIHLAFCIQGPTKYHRGFKHSALRSSGSLAQRLDSGNIFHAGGVSDDVQGYPVMKAPTRFKTDAEAAHDCDSIGNTGVACSASDIHRPSCQFRV